MEINNPLLYNFGPDNLIIKEVIDSVRKNISTFEFSLTFLSNLSLCIVNILIIIGIKYIITDPTKIKPFFSTAWDWLVNLFTIQIELSEAVTADIIYLRLIINDRYVVDKLLTSDDFSYKISKFMATIEIAKKSEKITVRYNIIHKRYISNLRSRINDELIVYQQEKLSKKNTPQTKCYTSSKHTDKSFEFTTYQPCPMYETRWYKRLFDAIERHIFISKELDCFTSLPILIDGEPGLGKTRFIDYLARKRICGTVTKIDMTKLLKHDFKTIINYYMDNKVIFSDIISEHPNVLLIDELDKYLDYNFSYNYSIDKDNYNKKKKDSGPDFMDEDEYKKGKKMTFLYELLSLIDTENHYKKCIIIFCANNFESIFENINMRHFHSLRKRFVNINFEKCDKPEIIGFIEYYNKILKKNTRNAIQKIKGDVSIPMRDLTQLLFESEYDFDKFVVLINQFNSNAPDSENDDTKYTIIAKSRSLKDLVEEYTDFNWDYYCLSMNRHMDLKYLRELIEAKKITIGDNFVLDMLKWEREYDMVEIINFCRQYDIKRVSCRNMTMEDFINYPEIHLSFVNDCKTFFKGAELSHIYQDDGKFCQLIKNCCDRGFLSYFFKYSSSDILLLYKNNYYRKIPEIRDKRHYLLMIWENKNVSIIDLIENVDRDLLIDMIKSYKYRFDITHDIQEKYNDLNLQVIDKEKLLSEHIDCRCCLMPDINIETTDEYATLVQLNNTAVVKPKNINPEVLRNKIRDTGNFQGIEYLLDRVPIEKLFRYRNSPYTPPIINYMDLDDLVKNNGLVRSSQLTMEHVIKYGLVSSEQNQDIQHISLNINP